jgi:hypothetical protein
MGHFYQREPLNIIRGIGRKTNEEDTRCSENTLLQCHSAHHQLHTHHVPEPPSFLCGEPAINYLRRDGK